MAGKNIRIPPLDVRYWIKRDFKLTGDGVVDILRGGNPRIRFGYKIFRIPHEGKRYEIFEHHIVWYLSKGMWPEYNLDHIDRNKLNNRVDNLRYATHSLNMQNKEPGKLPAGVKQKKNGVYEAYIRVLGKKIYLGRSRDPDECHGMYLDAWNTYYGVEQEELDDKTNGS